MKGFYIARGYTRGTNALNMDNISDEDILNYMLKNSKLNIDDVRNNIIDLERKKILRQHQYEIWQASDGRWRSYLPDTSKSNGRRAVAKTSREKLEDEIVEFYKNDETREMASKITLANFYDEWLDYKSQHTKRSTSIYRLDKDWIKYYMNEPMSQNLINTPIKEINKIDVDNWSHGICKKYDMTKKCYYNMSGILRNMLDYAVDKQYVDKNIFREVKFNTDLFRKKVKPKSETQVFTKEEQNILIEQAYKSYQEDSDNVLYLMVPLFFLTGVRLGELSALAWEDVYDDYLLIHRMYARIEEKDENSNWKITKFEVIDSLKHNASPREVLITTEVHDVLNKVKEHYGREGMNKIKYIFLDRKGNHPNPGTVDSMFYRLCKNAGIPKRSPHKIRKTYISTLIDKDMNLNFIREQVGHKDERTTLENYCFNRLSKKDTMDLLKSALS